MTQTLKLPALSVGTPTTFEARGANDTNPILITAPTTNLLTWENELLFYEEEILEYH